MTTLRITLLVIEQTTEAPESERAAIDTTGELVRARPIRKIIPKHVDANKPGSALAALDSWVRKAVG